jgi:hypothetical protein
MKRTILIFAISLTIGALRAQTFNSQFSDIPRIDVHVHVNSNYRSLVEYLNLRSMVMEQCGADVAMWIDLSQGNVDTIRGVTKGRMLCSFSTYRPAVTGIEYYKKSDIDKLKEQGYIGYKLWYAPASRQGSKTLYKYIDNQAHEPAFTELERQDVLMTSLHIADPNGSFDLLKKSADSSAIKYWVFDPADFWCQISGFERVLNRHPNLRVIAAHGAWLMTQDAQLDYLRYLLDTYPNLNIDVAATFKFCNLPSYDNLRDFYIHYQDRILWGTDNMRVEIPGTVKKCIDWFRFLETDKVMNDLITADKKPMKGLGLPREVLEKIYYKNALRLYPQVLATSMKKLGYKI